MNSDDRDPQLRASDAEREATAGLLGRHYLAGRLTESEHRERVEACYGARTLGDLRALLAELPDERPEAAPGRRRGPVRLLVLPLLVLLAACSAVLHAPVWLLAVPVFAASRGGFLRGAHGPCGRGPGRAAPG